MNDRARTLELLRTADLTLRGRLVDASNASFVGELRSAGGETRRCVYKPLRGEAPLDDFPDGTLGHREIAAYLVSEGLGWNIVPPTAWREAGPYGPGVAQLWIDAEPADFAALVHTGEAALRRIVVFDAVVNNGDRKGGHLLPIGEHVYGVDHGVSFSVEPKLRTILWAWHGETFDAAMLAALNGLRGEIGGGLGEALATWLSPLEVAATRARVERLLAGGRYPEPDPGRRVVPWPPF